MSTHLMSSLMSRIVIVGSLAISFLVASTDRSAAETVKTITIRLLNAKNGKPVPNQLITIRWKDELFAEEDVLLDKNGQVTVQVPTGAEWLSLKVGHRIGKDPNRVPYWSCNESYPPRYQLAEVFEKGVVPQMNPHCGKRTVPPRPGEVVFWAIPKRWWIFDLD